jgi:hypothetical protein
VLTGVASDLMGENMGDTLVVDEARLERIEQKLDRLSEAIVSLARIEERMVTLFNRSDLVETRVERLSERVAAMERMAGTIKFGERLFWVAVSTAAGLVAFWMKSG